MPPTDWTEFEAELAGIETVVPGVERLIDELTAEIDRLNGGINSEIAAYTARLRTQKEAIAAAIAAPGTPA